MMEHLSVKNRPVPGKSCHGFQQVLFVGAKKHVKNGASGQSNQRKSFCSLIELPFCWHWSALQSQHHQRRPRHPAKIPHMRYHLPLVTLALLLLQACRVPCMRIVVSMGQSCATFLGEKKKDNGLL